MPQKEKQTLLTRRDLVKAGGAVGVAALATGIVVSADAVMHPEAAHAATGENTQNAFWFDAEACIGCQICAATCRSTYDLEKSYRSVYKYSYGEGGEDGQYNVSVGCSLCDNPACMSACPTGAMHKTEDFGHVVVDTSKCIGCGYCDMACPYNIPRVDREAGHSVKCDGCYDLVSQGGDPACAEACPQDALRFGTLEKMLALGGETANIAPLPEPHYTTPNFIISASKDKPAAGTTEGEITNLEAIV